MCLLTLHSTGNPQTKVNKRRKSADRVGEIIFNDYGKQLLNCANNLCKDADDSNEYYLDAALKESQKSSSSTLSSVLDSVVVINSILKDVFFVRFS